MGILGRLVKDDSSSESPVPSSAEAVALWKGGEGDAATRVIVAMTDLRCVFPSSRSRSDRGPQLKAAGHFKNHRPHLPRSVQQPATNRRWASGGVRGVKAFRFATRHGKTAWLPLTDC